MSQISSNITEGEWRTKFCQLHHELCRLMEIDPKTSSTRDLVGEIYRLKLMRPSYFRSGK